MWAHTCVRTHTHTHIHTKSDMRAYTHTHRGLPAPGAHFASMDHFHVEKGVLYNVITECRVVGAVHTLLYITHGCLLLYITHYYTPCMGVHIDGEGVVYNIYRIHTTEYSRGVDANLQNRALCVCTSSTCTT